MKTAEEWLESNRLNGVSSDSAMIHISELKQIQLDAMKEGMRRAANTTEQTMVTGTPWANKTTIKSAILTAAEQLTEKDL